jgi:HK97 family phage portal protein
MKIFGWKSAGRGFLRPVQARVALARPYWARGAGGVAMGTWPTAYEAQLREGYLNNAIAQRAVRLVAEGVASAPLNSNDPAALAMVKETSGGQCLLETVAAHLLLHGNAYIELIAGPDCAPVELYALRPERVAVEADSRGWPMAFLYKAGEVTTRMPAESVIHIRNMHPLDDHYGLGCLGAASGAVAIHNAAAKWNKALLDNAARPSGALTYDTGDTGALSNEQFDRLRAELDAGFAGAMNAGRPMLLEGGLKWQALSMSPADMDFISLKEGAAREIALAFGVPPMLIGLPGDATYANYREANKALWRQAILPLAGKILDALCQGLRPWFADVQLGIDLDHVSALSEDRERLWAQVGAADFLSVDEKRAAAGFAPLKNDASPAINDGKNKTGILELKFNPWHDTQDGKFTQANQGNYAGGGGSFGGGGASGTWPKAKPQPNKPSGGRVGGGGASGTWKPTKLKPGGGSFGGGGASGS